MFYIGNAILRMLTGSGFFNCFVIPRASPDIVSIYYDKMRYISVNHNVIPQGHEFHQVYIDSLFVLIELVENSMLHQGQITLFLVHRVH